jgi:hypothetical protein
MGKKVVDLKRKCSKCHFIKSILDFEKVNNYRTLECSKCLYIKRKVLYSKEYFAIKSKKWRAKNQEKIKAHSIVGVAIKNGLLKKPTKCSKCSSKMKIHAHHDNYSKPLDVVWLCHYCHRLIHKLMKLDTNIRGLK